MITQVDWFLQRVDQTHDSLPPIPRIVAVVLAATACTTASGESIALHMAEHGALHDKHPQQLLDYLAVHFEDFWFDWTWVDSPERRKAALGHALRRAIRGNDDPAYRKPNYRGPRPKADPNGQLVLGLPGYLTRGRR